MGDGRGERWAFLGIVAGALLLRLVALSRVPPGLFVDEAYTGYDALSLLQTGRDLNGHLLPLYFPAWGGDAVEGLYRYLCVPFVALLGASELAVRLPAALAGTATVALTGLLGRRLLGARQGLLAAALLALSPWHLHFSRIAFRGILLPLAVTGAAWLAAGAAGLGPPGTLPRPRRWFAAAVAAGVGIYTYSVAKLFVPAFTLLSAGVFRDRIRAQRRGAAAVLALLALLAIPAVRETVTGEGQVRFRQISILRAEALDQAGERLLRDHPGWPGVRFIAGNHLLTGMWLFVTNYGSHFGPRFLVLEGDDNLRHSPPGIGQLYLVEGLLLVVGVAVALRRRGRADAWLLGWLLIGPLGDSLTADRIPNALRALATIPAPQLLAAAGGAALLSRIRPRRLGLAVAAALAVAGCLQAGRYLDRYFRVYPAESAPYWNAGYAEGIRLLVREAPAGTRLLVARPERFRAERYALNPVVHSLVLFYAGPPPPEVRRGAGLGRFEVLTLPEEGQLSASALPAGAWALLPADRVRPDEVRRWVPGPGGEPAMAVLVGEGGT